MSPHNQSVEHPNRIGYIKGHFPIFWAFRNSLYVDHGGFPITENVLPMTRHGRLSQGFMYDL